MTHTKPYVVKKHLVGVLLFLACFSASFPLTVAAHYYRGTFEAHWDVAHGNYKGRRCAHACMRRLPGFEPLLLKYANFRLETTDDCGYRTKGYNDVQWERIERLYPGAHERAFQEAMDLELRRLQNMNE